MDPLIRLLLGSYPPLTVIHDASMLAKSNDAGARRVDILVQMTRHHHVEMREDTACIPLPRYESFAPSQAREPDAACIPLPRYESFVPSWGKEARCGLYSTTPLRKFRAKPSKEARHGLYSTTPLGFFRAKPVKEARCGLYSTTPLRKSLAKLRQGSKMRLVFHYPATKVSREAVDESQSQRRRPAKCMVKHGGVFYAARGVLTNTAKMQWSN